jgi:hypothetical protein
MLPRYRKIINALQEVIVRKWFSVRVYMLDKNLEYFYTFLIRKEHFGMI